jgi:hypothetical protein
MTRELPQAAPLPPVPVPASQPSALTFEAPAGHINGIEPLAAFEDDEEAVFTTDTSQEVNSAASLATEILSASPEIAAIAVPEERESVFITQDVTLIARDRRKRFRLR